MTTQLVPGERGGEGEDQDYGMPRVRNLLARYGANYGFQKSDAVEMNVGSVAKVEWDLFKRLQVYCLVGFTSLVASSDFCYCLFQAAFCAGSTRSDELRVVFW